MGKLTKYAPVINGLLYLILDYSRSCTAWRVWDPSKLKDEAIWYPGPEVTFTLVYPQGVPGPRVYPQGVPGPRALRRVA